MMVLREFKIKSHVHPRNVCISTTEYDEITGHTSERKSHFVHFRGNPSSPLCTSHLELNNNDGNSDDDLLDLNDFIPETTAPKPLQVSHDEYVTMKGAASPNQADGSGPNSSAQQASSSVPENNSSLPAQGSAGEPIQPPSTRATLHLRFRKKTLHLHFCKPTLQFSR